MYLKPSNAKAHQLDGCGHGKRISFFDQLTDMICRLMADDYITNTNNKEEDDKGGDDGDEGDK